MPEQEQNSGSGPSFDTGRDEWGTTESPYDADGFVKEEAPVYELAANGNEQIKNIEDDVKSRDARLDRLLETDTNVRDRIATLKDVSPVRAELRGQTRRLYEEELEANNSEIRDLNNSLIELYKQLETVDEGGEREIRQRINDIHTRRQEALQRRRVSSVYGYHRNDGSQDPEGEIAGLEYETPFRKEDIEWARSRIAEKRQLADGIRQTYIDTFNLNPEKVGVLPVSEFIKLVDMRTEMGRQIDELIERAKYAEAGVASLGERIESGSYPLDYGAIGSRLEGTARSLSDGERNELQGDIKGLIEVAFDTTPRSMLQSFRELQKGIANKLRVLIKETTQAQVDLDNRIKSGDIDALLSGDNQTGVASAAGTEISAG